MKKCPKCLCWKPLQAFNKHRKKKYGRDSYCRVCNNSASAAWREANPERMAALNKKWSEANPERAAASCKAWREANPERMAALNKAWREANPDKTRAHEAKRRARKKFATLDWADKVFNDAIAGKYALAKKLEAETGEPYHVDHIWPIKGYPTLPEGISSIDEIDFYLLPEYKLMRWDNTFCGVHAPWNLEAIPGSDNLSKSNKRPVDSDGNERPASKWSKTEDDY